MTDADELAGDNFERRGREMVTSVLERWLADRFDRPVRIRELALPPGPGASNETYLLTADIDGDTHRLVAQIGPAGEGLFPVYDLPTTAWIQHRLAAVPPVPVARVRYVEADPGLLGSSFYVMDHVEGRVPPELPPYHREGVLADAAPEERERAWWSGIDALAALHGLNRDDLSLLVSAPWGMPPESAPAMARLTQWRAYLEWAAPDPAPAILEGLDALQRRLPEPVTPAPHWGGARLTNCVIGEDHTVAAMLDWELCGLSDPYEDLAHWLMSDWVAARRAGTGRLAGLPGAADTLARYATRAGTDPDPARAGWWSRFALVRRAIIAHRALARWVAMGRLPADTSLAAANPVASLIPDAMGTDEVWD